MLPMQTKTGQGEPFKNMRLTCSENGVHISAHTNATFESPESFLASFLRKHLTRLHDVNQMDGGTTSIRDENKVPGFELWGKH
ncbi:unnamed protein product [Strongylus vulgaris]|uniref:Uncharacterized protein n=1 Tax=Strongylus vulgaris TaxID=40348 RepID=A0A3P7JFL4_STRVU|nr:unnamed protein product [Strongylus vulgaris]